MKVEKSLVERYYLKEDWTYADIHISDDGALSIRSDYGDYAYKWGSFCDSFKDFLISINDDYLINKLGGANSYIFDFSSTIKAIKEEIIDCRKDYGSFDPEAIILDQKEAREMWDEIEELEYTDNKDIFFINIMNTQYYEIVCDNDPYNVPCKDMVHPQLNSFTKEIWPHFIDYLKKEKENV